ncbi:unnamed protein product [Coffea canephora]|uniref:Uncharacterized protein n=1 Tax=Coffea canephora TaxID=49390 RepID=A0A068V7W2_COFCA|nr:unnamed protein product [Coffea canephora]
MEIYRWIPKDLIDCSQIHEWPLSTSYSRQLKLMEERGKSIHPDSEYEHIAYGCNKGSTTDGAEPL